MKRIKRSDIMQEYDFDTVIDRSKNYSSKWDELGQSSER